MSLFSSIIKNTVFLSTGQLAGKFLTMILTALLARALGPAGIGKYVFAGSMIAMFYILPAFGFDTLLIREVARSRKNSKKLIPTFLAVKLVSAILASILLLFFVSFRKYDQQMIGIIYIMSVSAILNSILSTFYSIFRAYERMGIEAILTMINNSLRLLFGMVAIQYGLHLKGIITALVAADILSFLAALFFLCRSSLSIRFRIDRDVLRQLFRSVIPFGILSVIHIVWTNTDNLMIAKLENEMAVGWYSAANKILWFLLLIPNMFMCTIFPVFSRLSMSDANSLRLIYSKSFCYLMILGFPIGVGGFILSDQIILFVYGEQFLNTILVFQVMVWVTMIGFVGFLNGATLNATGRERLFATTYSLFTIANVVLDYILIEQYGYIGASYGTLILTGLGFVLYSTICHRQLAVKPEWVMIAKGLLASVGMGAVILYLKKLSLNLSVLVPTGGIIYLALILLLRTLPHEDARTIRQLALRSPVIGTRLQNKFRKKHTNF